MCPLCTTLFPYSCEYARTTVSRVVVYSTWHRVPSKTLTMCHFQHVHVLILGQHSFACCALCFNLWVNYVVRNIYCQKCKCVARPSKTHRRTIHQGILLKRVLLMCREFHYLLIYRMSCFHSLDNKSINCTHCVINNNLWNTKANETVCVFCFICRSFKFETTCCFSYCLSELLPGSRCSPT